MDKWVLLVEVIVGFFFGMVFMSLGFEIISIIFFSIMALAAIMIPFDFYLKRKVQQSTQK